MIEQINEIQKTTSLDLENIIIQYDDEHYIIKIPVVNLDDVFVELIL